MLISSAYAQAPAGAPPGGDMSFFIMMIVMFGVLYFFMIRPQMKRQKEQKKMVDELQKGDDLTGMARAAAERGADCLGAAGGDGTQAQVALVCIERQLPFVCIPAGTRNHFALDLGLDRDDPLGGLRAFGDAYTKRIDVGEVNGDMFLNNVSIGAYGEVVAEEQYRENKIGTALAKLPADRFASAAEFAAVLNGTSPTRVMPRGRRADRMAWGRWVVPAAVSVVLAGLAAWGWLRPKGIAGAAGTTRADVVLPESAPVEFIGEATIGVGQTAIAISAATEDHNQTRGLQIAERINHIEQSIVRVGVIHKDAECTMTRNRLQTTWHRRSIGQRQQALPHADVHGPRGRNCGE